MLQNARACRPLKRLRSTACNRRTFKLGKKKRSYNQALPVPFPPKFSRRAPQMTRQRLCRPSIAVAYVYVSTVSADRGPLETPRASWGSHSPLWHSQPQAPS